MDKQEAKLRAELDGSGVSVVRDGVNITLSMPGNVTFATDSSDLSPAFFEVLNSVGKVLVEYEQTVVEVAGHTDSKPYRGTFRDNWGLSLMRARGVLLYLVGPEKGALPPNRWSAAGFGDTDPVADNETVDGRQQNRRCELIVVPSAEEMLDLQKIAK